LDEITRLFSGQKMLMEFGEWKCDLITG
jgi:hypothetical protein